jgi:hypothetical protein
MPSPKLRKKEKEDERKLKKETKKRVSIHKKGFPKAAAPAFSQSSL